MNRTIRPWRPLLLAAAFVAAALVTATGTATAQEAVVLTPQQSTFTSTIGVGSGGAQQEVWIDYQPGQFVSVRVIPASHLWWTLTDNPGGRSRDRGFLVEVWGPNGRVGQADFRRTTAPDCANCWVFFSDKEAAADVVDTAPGRYLVKVMNYSDLVVPYTLEARGLELRATVAGAPPGASGPLLERQDAHSGTLVGSTSGTSAYYTVYNTERARIRATISPRPPAPQRGLVGMNVYRGAQLLTTIRGGSDVPGAAADSPGNALQLQYDRSTTTPEWLTVEVFNYIPGYPLQYAVANLDA